MGHTLVNFVSCTNGLCFVVAWPVQKGSYIFLNSILDYKISASSLELNMFLAVNVVKYVSMLYRRNVGLCFFLFLFLNTLGSQYKLV